MSDSRSENSLTLCLVTDDPLIESAVKASCQPPNQLAVFRRAHLVNGHHTISDHGREIVKSAASADVILIDWSFEEAPAINTLCFQIRRDLRAPVLMLCNDGPKTMTACVAAGADDAISLPIYLPYIQAKVLSYRRLINATRSADPAVASSLLAQSGTHEMVYGELRLNRVTHRFYVGKEEVELTPREFKLLEYFIRRSDTLCTRSEILDAVWGINFDTGTNMVDVYAHYLRRKLEARGLKEMIQTVRGLGYRLVGMAPQAGAE